MIAPMMTGLCSADNDGIIINFGSLITIFHGYYLKYIGKPLLPL